MQRIVSLCVTGAIRTTPTDARDIGLFLPHLDLVGEENEMATNSPIGLTVEWKLLRALQDCEHDNLNPEG